METERAHRLPQPGQPIIGLQHAAVGTQRRVDDVQIGQQIVGCPVRRQAEVELVLGLAVQDSRRGRGEPRAHHLQSPPVRLVESRRVVAAIGQHAKLIGDRHQARRHRQLPLERGELDEVVSQSGVGGAAGGQPYRAGGYIRVAVAVATNPRSGPQERFFQELRIGPQRLHHRPHLGIDLRNHLHEGRVVILQPHLDLVPDPQPTRPNQRGLPQHRHVQAQFVLDVAAVGGLCLAVQAQPHQLGDPVLGIEDRAAARLGRVGGHHRGHQRIGERLCHRRGIQVGGVEFPICGGQAAVLWWLPGSHMESAPPLAMNVFGDVGQQRELRQSPDHRDRLMDIHAVEHARQIGAVDLGAAHPKRLEAGALNEVEHLVAVVRADRVAEDRAEQPDVLAHRLGRLAAGPRAPYRANRRELENRRPQPWSQVSTPTS